ncbi:MAG TPA: acyltransferase [Chthoniobacterales bacterium]|nr:acyltransferase [Chthoniobacterales bacterium]
MGWATYWAGAGVGSSRADVFKAGETLARDRALEHYQPQFDGLRALAVLTVMVDHFTADVPNFPLPDWIHLGATGVRLFLVLSGYFITASLRRARDRMENSELSAGRTIRAFYWRRLLRIGPAYFVFAGIALLLDFGSIRHNWPWVFTGTVNWLIAWQDRWPLTISHLWSICVQEQFYLFWPLLILLLPRRCMLPAIIAVAFAGIAFRIGCVIFSAPIIARWVLPFGSLDSLAAGAALGWCGGRLRASRGGWLLALLCLSMLTVAAVLRNSDPTKLKSVLVEPLEACAFAILVARTATGFDGNIARFLSNPALVFAGRISYGLYIYHILVALVFNRWLPPEMRFLITIPSLRLVVFGIATLFTAALSWRLLEQPINRLRGEKTRKALGPIPPRSWEMEVGRLKLGARSVELGAAS